MDPEATAPLSLSTPNRAYDLGVLLYRVWSVIASEDRAVI
jgi:hypothetical protein